MEGPSDDFRRRIGESLGKLGNDEAVSELLGLIQSELLRDIDKGFDQEPNQILASVDGWAGLASHVVARFYAPASPWPLDIAGWGRAAIRKLRDVANTLRTPLSNAAKGTGAASWTIAVGFPWGISVGLTWQ